MRTNRDGRQDLIVSLFMQPGVRAFLAPPSNGEAWSSAWIRDDYIATDLYTGDVNLDGHIDIAAVSFGRPDLGIPSSVAWFERVASEAGIEWIIHHIDYGTNKFPSDLELKEVDGDGDLDVVTGTLGEDAVLWYENPHI